MDDLSRDDAIALISSAGFPEALDAVKLAAQRFFGKLAEDDAENPPPAA